MTQHTIYGYLFAAYSYECANSDPDVDPIVSADDIQIFVHKNNKFLKLQDIVFEETMAQFEKRQLCETFRTPHARPRYQLKTKSIQSYVATQLERKDSIVFLYSKLGFQWLSESILNLIRIQNAEPAETSELAGDDFWEPLPLERSSVELQNGLESLQAVYEAVRADNGYAATYPKERASVVDTLFEGVRWLKEKSQITKRAFVTLILDPLKKIIDRFKEALPGALAKSAIDALVKYFPWT
jgi:hypothetical protein